MQRCTVHKHRNLFAHAPERLHDEITTDYNDMIAPETTPASIPTNSATAPARSPHLLSSQKRHDFRGGAVTQIIASCWLCHQNPWTGETHEKFSKIR